MWRSCDLGQPERCSQDPEFARSPVRKILSSQDSPSIFCLLSSVFCPPSVPRRGGRAVDCTGLENRRGGNSTGGSNPSLSANSGRNKIHSRVLLRIRPSLEPPFILRDATSRQRGRRLARLGRRPGGQGRGPAPRAPSRPPGGIRSPCGRARRRRRAGASREARTPTCRPSCRATDRHTEARTRQRCARPSPEALPLWTSSCGLLPCSVDQDGDNQPCA